MKITDKIRNWLAGTWLCTHGLPTETTASGRIKELCFENARLRDDLEHKTMVAAGKEIVIQNQAAEIYRLKQELKAVKAELATQRDRYCAAAAATRALLTEKNEQIARAEGKSDMYIQAFRRGVKV